MHVLSSISSLSDVQHRRCLLSIRAARQAERAARRCRPLSLLLTSLALIEARVARTHHAYGTIGLRLYRHCRRRIETARGRTRRAAHGTAARTEAARRATAAEATVVRRHRVERAMRDRRLLDVRCCHRSQVISSLEAPHPRQLVALVELLARRAAHVDIERLRLVDPLLPARGRLDEPLRIDFERRRVD